MNEFLIDTNIYSHAMRAEPAVVSLLRRASRIVLSSISIGELLSGFKGGTQERKNREELAEFLDTRRVSICGVSEGYSRVLCRDPQWVEECWNPDPDERHLDCGAGHGARFAIGLNGSPISHPWRGCFWFHQRHPCRKGTTDNRTSNREADRRIGGGLMILYLFGSGYG